MNVEADKLIPYISATLATVESDDSSSIVEDLVAKIEQLLPEVGRNAKRALVRHVPADTTEVGGNSLSSRGFIYSVSQPPRWLTANEIEDVVHHLVLVCLSNNALGIYASEPSMGRNLGIQLRSSNDAIFQRVKLFDEAQLNGAFLQGRARSIWMSGLHRQSDLKANSKVLTGRDLRQALNPLEDQTYRFTAARSLIEDSDRSARPETDLVVGVNSSKSRVWVGPSKDWNDFASVLHYLLGLANAAEPNLNPLPVLAKPSNVNGLRTPFDITVMDPTLLDPSNLPDEEERTQVETWAYGVKFEIVCVRSTCDFDVEVTLEGRCLGSIRVKIKPRGEAQVSISIRTNGKRDDDLADAMKAMRRRDWLTIRYESGHAISGRRVFEYQFQDREFRHWEWSDFKSPKLQFDITREKPVVSGEKGKVNVNAIGSGRDTSLFSWVRRCWKDRVGNTSTGWLASDDGAGEVADFIHLDESGPVPLLSLIHIKASGSKDPSRGISVSEYEVVAAQAQKNLRFLNPGLLAETLDQRKHHEIAAATWRNGRKAKNQRTMMIKRLDGLGSNLDAQIVIVQPRTTRRSHSQAHGNAGGSGNASDIARMRQLNALLLETQLACQAVGAEFKVIGSA